MTNTSQSLETRFPAPAVAAAGIWQAELRRRGRFAARPLTALLCAALLAACGAARADSPPELPGNTGNEQVQNRGADKDNWWDSLPRPEWSAFERIEHDQDWFEVFRVADGVFAVYEPGQFEEVISFLITGEQRALLFDTGLGIGDMARLTAQLTDLDIIVLNSHSHYDHVGGNAGFATIWAPDTEYTRRNAAGNEPEDLAEFVGEGWVWKPFPEGFVAAGYRNLPYTISRTVADGDVIDLGGRQLEVLQTPGHAPDAICLLDRANRMLFTGDTFYLAPLYAHLEGSDFLEYVATAKRLAGLVGQVDRLLTSHNVPVADAHYLTSLGAAFAAIDTAAAGDFVVSDGNREYRFDGFSVIVGQPAPAFDCAQTEHEIEDLICSDVALSARDRRLADVYAASLDVLHNAADGAEAARALRATQRGWIKGRNDCWKANDGHRCTRDSYDRRIAYLQARYFLIEGGEPLVYRCDDNSEIVATFVPTEPAGVRLERGDTLQIGLLTPAASGAKYAADFGVTFWTSGDGARVEWPQGNRFNCTVRR